MPPTKKQSPYQYHAPLVRGRYFVALPKVYTIDFPNSALQTDGFDFLCPQCGGYKKIFGQYSCEYCIGLGVISFDDGRIK